MLASKSRRGSGGIFLPCGGNISSVRDVLWVKALFKKKERGRCMEDQEAFLRHAMETHGDAVYRLALCRLQNRAEAEDVYQDVFLTLLRQPERKWEQDHLKAWLLRTALHRCADVKRRWLRHPVRRWRKSPGILRTPGRMRRSSGRAWRVCRGPCAWRCISSTERGTPRRRSPGFWIVPRPRCAHGCTGPGKNSPPDHIPP